MSIFACQASQPTLKQLFIKKGLGFLFNGALSGLKRFLQTESPWKMIKNAFYFTLKLLFVLKIFKFLF